jgi:N-acetylmuramoyl-L-alanine amidase
MATVTPDSPWRTLPPLSADTYRRVLAPTFLGAVAGDLHALASGAGLSALMLGQIVRESGPGLSEWAETTRNPLNLRPVGPADSRPVAVHPRDGIFLAFAGPLDFAAEYVWRLSDPTYKGGVYARTTSILELIGVYAPRGDGANDPGAYAAALCADLNWWIGLETPPIAKQRVVVVPGHRGIGDDGSREEAALTPALAREYVRALKAAGHDAWYLPEHDADTMPDNTQGGLDGVGRETLSLCREVGATAMLDVHYEGAGNSAIRGLFAIVPDATGLRTAIAGGAPADDTYAANVLDRQLAAAIALRLSEQTKIPRRHAQELGIMSERQTYVGASQGARLAMFAYTAPVRATCVRLVVEHGALTNPSDRALIYQEGFTQQCAAGLVRAFADVFGAVAVPTPAPAPVPTLDYPDGMDEGIARWLFGTVTIDGKASPFDPSPKGFLSRAWLEAGRQTARWGIGAGVELGTLRRFDAREYLPMAGGLVLWRANNREAFRPLGAS